MQGQLGMVGKGLKELSQQVYVEFTHPGTGIFDFIGQPGAAGTVHYYPGQGFIEWHVGMAIAPDPLLVTQGAGKRLAYGDADILHRMMGVDLKAGR